MIRAARARPDLIAAARSVASTATSCAAAGQPRTGVLAAAVTDERAHAPSDRRSLHPVGAGAAPEHGCRVGVQVLDARRAFDQVEASRWAALAGRGAFFSSIPRWSMSSSARSHVVACDRRRRGERVDGEPVAERQLARLDDVRRRHELALLQGGEGLRALQQGDVRPVADDADLQAEGADRLVEVVRDAHAGEQGLGAHDRARQGRLLLLPGRGERGRVGGEGLSAAEHLRSRADVADRRDFDLQSQPVGELRAQIALLRVHRPDEQEARRMRRPRRPRARRR